MKKCMLLGTIMMFVSVVVSSQTRQIGDTLYVNDTVRFVVGEKVKFGRPVNDRDFFTYVTDSPILGQLHTAKDNSDGFGKSYSGRQYKIKKIERVGNEENGYKYYVVVKTSVLSAWIDIENAIATKEVIIP
jgi:hypothetical protein